MNEITQQQQNLLKRMFEAVEQARQETFTNAEIKGRELFGTLCDQQEWCKVKRYTQQRFDPYDAVIYSGGQQTMTEIKVREYSSMDWNTWHLEVEKYYTMKEIQELHPTTRIQYVNHLTDGITLIWDLTDVDMTTFKQSVELCQDNNVDKKPKMKMVYHLPSELAVKYTNNIDLKIK